MDTMTYASVAVIPGSVAQKNKRLAVPEAELGPLDLSYIGRTIGAEISKLKEQYAELKEDVRKLSRAVSNLAKNRQILGC